MRGAWGDFARLCSREGVGGEPLQPTLVPQYWGVNATGRGRQCSLWGAKGCLLVGKRSREVAWLGGTAPPFSFVPGKFVSSALLRARQVALLTHPTPTPASPGAGLAWLGTGSRGPGLGPCDCRPEPAWVPGKVRGSCRGCRVRWERSCVRDLGRWAGGRVGEWSRALVGSSAEVGEGLVGSVPPKVG